MYVNTMLICPSKRNTLQYYNKIQYSNAKSYVLKNHHRAEFEVLTKAEIFKHHKGTIQCHSSTVHALLFYLDSLYYTYVLYVVYV